MHSTEDTQPSSTNHGSSDPLDDETRAWKPSQAPDQVNPWDETRLYRPASQQPTGEDWQPAAPPPHPASSPYAPRLERRRRGRHMPQFPKLRWPRRRPAESSPLPPAAPRQRKRLPPLRCGCLAVGLLALLCAALGLSGYLLYPMDHTILLLGIDYSDPWNYTARSDTIILSRFSPTQPYIGLLSVPRDLWVMVPNVGENRINTAHFYAEAQAGGSGPQAVLDTLQLNFGMRPEYYVRVRFEGFKEIVNALGGVDIELTEPMAGYEPGKYHLSGNKALAFVRQRMGSDDFFRMEHGQFMMKAVLDNMLSPLNWPRLPAVWRAFQASIDTNLPNWIWPRLAFTLLRVGPSGIDSRTINREMVTPFTTSDGASVLAPNWDAILPVMKALLAP